MAKENIGAYIVAGIQNHFGHTGEQGVELGRFRTIEFARRAKESMRKEALKKHWSGTCGIFLNGKLLEEL